MRRRQRLVHHPGLRAITNRGTRADASVCRLPCSHSRTANALVKRPRMAQCFHRQARASNEGNRPSVLHSGMNMRTGRPGPDVETSHAGDQKQPPGLVMGIGSIVAGVVGFSIPVLGMAAAALGICFGLRAAVLGRRGNCVPSVICGIIGTILCGLSIAFWIGAILFESYH
jgi:hypothetical protein